MQRSVIVGTGLVTERVVGSVSSRAASVVPPSKNRELHLKRFAVTASCVNGLYANKRSHLRRSPGIKVLTDVDNLNNPKKII